MAQKIQPGSIFGRIGSGVGKGLAEQLPKEIERGRLASGLKNFEQQHQNLNPMQQLARLSAIPGITPQMIQSFSDLAKQQNLGNAYRRIAGQGQQGYGAESQMQNEAGPNQQFQLPNFMGQQPGQNIPAKPEMGNKLVNENHRGIQTQPQLANYNPGDPNALTREPWTPEQRAARKQYYIDNGFLPDQAEVNTEKDEAAYLAVPAARQQQQKDKRARQVEAEAILDKQLQTRLQSTKKEGEEAVYKDITGDMLVDIRRAFSKKLMEHPELTVDDVAEDFSKRALRLAENKKELEALAAKTGWESFFQGDKTLNKLKSFQKTFADAGNQKEFFNILREKFKLSPQGAAFIAYPAGKNVKNYIENWKPKNTKFTNYADIPIPEKIESNSRKAAYDISEIIGDDDNLLAIAKQLSEKDPYFDQRVFFDELTDNPIINERLSDNHKSQRNIGERDYIPTWGDVKIFPLNFRRSRK